jgi:Ca2+-binding EF-hand superfamily protein
MNRLVSTLFTAAAICASSSAFAIDNTLKMMDTNGDGMISETEYMKHHERMWKIFKKNQDGLVTIQDMERAPGMRKDLKMMKDDKMAKDVKMK